MEAIVISLVMMKEASDWQSYIKRARGSKQELSHVHW